MILTKLKSLILERCPFLVESEWSCFIGYRLPDSQCRLIHIDTRNDRIYIPNSVCLWRGEYHIANNGEPVFEWDSTKFFCYSTGVYDDLILSALNEFTMEFKKCKLNKKIESIEKDFL